MDGFTLAIIAKDEASQIQRIVSLYSSYFEEIVVAYDGDPIPDIKGVRFIPYKWQNDFSHKRNYLAEHINTEYYFRMDTDDAILDDENLLSLFSKILKTKPDCIYVPYIYGRDKDGNCIAEHWRETVIRKDPNIYWKKSIHENIFIEDQDKFNGAKDSSIKILHLEEPGHSEKSFQRNLKILIEEYNRDKENTDPRTIAYLGRMLMGVGQWQKAVTFLEILVRKSGWDDDKYFAYVELGFCHFQLGNYSKAVSACFEALSINPGFPDAYICLGENYIQQQNFDKAKTWLMAATSKERPDTMYVTDPSRYTVRLAINLAAAHLGGGEFDKACAFFSKAKGMAPNNAWVKENEKLFEEGYENDQYFRNLVWTLAYTRDRDKDKIKNLVESIPKNMYSDERVQKLRHEVLPAKKWASHTVAIFCGQGWEEWASPSTITGLGGSEEAVVYLSKELVKLGLSVTVFNNCGELAGEYNGVKYKPFYEFNPKDEYNILISWRGNIFKQREFKANKKYIWMHDVPQPDQFKEDELNTFDKAIVLSQYHRSLFPSYMPDDKFFISSNGINLEDFNTNGIQRNPYRMIYASSYDRGVQHLLLRWDKIRKEIPEAELHLFYGWDVYDRMAEQGHRSWAFKEKMVELMSQPGIIEHGRVGHKQLIKEFQKSSLFVYPSHFEEISCITAMKAQACGCVPVVTGYAALKETVKDGIMVEGNADDQMVINSYTNALILNLKELEDVEDLRVHVEQHKEEFGWDKVAKQWKQEMFDASS